MTVLEMFSYAFMQRALVAGIFTALSCAALGCFLVLRRFAMIGDGLAHVGFAAVALSLVLGLAPLTLALPLVMLLSLWILKLGEKTTLYGETAVGLVSSLAMAAGVLLAGSGGGFNIDLSGYLFGSILAIKESELILSVILSAGVVLVIKLFYYDLFSLTYDEEFARVSGVKTGRIEKLLILLTALTVVLGIRVVGALLISSLIIFPAVTALQLSKGFRATILIAMACGVFSVTAGITASFWLELSTGATIVIVNFLLFIAAFAYSRIKS
ncbi:MAG: metal ABC transporter permease [Spirochaetales bacterium]|jgi:zinc transport system permease protein|nr:metal ABC transporter permease [Spirochaetales bacterium]